jgi:hypothetical protein
VAVEAEAVQQQAVAVEADAVQQQAVAAVEAEAVQHQVSPAADTMQQQTVPAADAVQQQVVPAADAVQQTRAAVRAWRSQAAVVEWLEPADSGRRVKRALPADDPLEQTLTQHREAYIR